MRLNVRGAFVLLLALLFFGPVHAGNNGRPAALETSDLFQGQELRRLFAADEALRQAWKVELGNAFHTQPEGLENALLELHAQYLRAIAKHSEQIEACKREYSRYGGGWAERLANTFDKQTIESHRSALLATLLHLHQKAEYECTEASLKDVIFQERAYKYAVTRYLDALTQFLTRHGSADAGAGPALAFLEAYRASMNGASIESLVLDAPMSIQISGKESADFALPPGLRQFMLEEPAFKKPFPLIKAAGDAGLAL